MRRLHFFEFGDQSWLPTFFRRGFTEYLATLSKWTGLYQPSAAPLAELLNNSQEKRVVVLGAGSGGGILDVLPCLPQDVEVVLTDILPDKNLHLPSAKVRYYPEPVNALQIPKTLKGVRVMFAVLHHFKPMAAKEIFRNAVQDNQPIAIIEATERTPLALAATALIIPFVILVIMPLIRPFSFARLFWTVVIPAFPILGAFDGFVSCLRTYNENDYQELVADFTTYDWRFRILRGAHGQRISIFTGMPKITVLAT